MSKPVVLLAADLPESTVTELFALFDVLTLPPEPAEQAAFLAQNGPRIRGMALRKTRVDADFLRALPQLEVISSYTAGLENLDVEAAAHRNIKVNTASEVLAQDVANLAIGLVLTVTRGITHADGWLRAGHWAKGGALPLTQSVIGKKVGILGLGSIGAALAPRLEALGARVAYASRSRKDVAYEHYPDARALAEAVDILILCCPLTPETHHIINDAVLTALGPQGYLVNVARGAVVDQAALVAALQAGTIAGAALDVFEDEPDVPAALIEDPRVVLTPHIGSATEQTRQRMAENVVDTLARHFGLPLPADRV